MNLVVVSNRVARGKANEPMTGGLAAALLPVVEKSGAIWVGSSGRVRDGAVKEPFAEVEALGAVVFIHPNSFTQPERFGKYYFSNVIGNPLDTTMALHWLIFDGVLERHPDLKIIAVHGGGYLPAYSGRIDHAWGARSDCRGDLPQPHGLPPGPGGDVFEDAVADQQLDGGADGTLDRVRAGQVREDLAGHRGVTDGEDGQDDRGQQALGVGGAAHAGDELLYLVEHRRGIANPVQRIFARELDHVRSGDALGKVVSVRDGAEARVVAMQDVNVGVIGL